MFGRAIVKELEPQTGDNVRDIHVNMDNVACVESTNMEDVYCATFVGGHSIYIDRYTFNQMARWLVERYPNYENYGYEGITNTRSSNGD